MCVMFTIYELIEKIFEKNVLEKIFDEPCHWSKSQFIERLGWSNIAVLKQPQPEILARPLPEFSNKERPAPAIIELLLDIFYRGYYSNDIYFTIDDAAEPATELLHGLECATYAYHAGATQKDIAAGLLHDIGRFYSEPDYANKHHHEDGYYLMAQLFGQEVGRFCYLHGYAKALLYDVIAGYPNGMTDVSMKTLQLQRQDFASINDYLSKIEDVKQRQFVVLHAMLMRILDDSSKYPLTAEFNLLPEHYVRALLIDLFEAHGAPDVTYPPLLNGLKSASGV